MAPDPAPAPLDGVRVLDFTQYFSGPVCTRMLAELGADVIKVELPPYGDPQRGSSPRANKRSGTYLSQNRGKRSLCLDYRSDHGRRVVGALLPHVDVVVENFAPGVMARRGLGYDEMQAINPRLILASITGFGQTGTWSHRPAFDAVIQAYSGVMHMTGEPDGAPNLAGLPVADTSAGIHAFGAIGFALYSRTITGRGTHIDIAMVDSLFHQHEIPIHARSLDPTYEAERAGRHHTTQCPAGSFRSPQGWVAIFCTNDQIDRLWEAMGRPISPPTTVSGCRRHGSSTATRSRSRSRRGWRRSRPTPTCSRRSTRIASRPLRWSTPPEPPSTTTTSSAVPSC